MSDQSRLSIQSKSSRDIDEHAAALPGWEQAYMQLDAGRFAGGLEHIAFADGLAVFRERTNLKIRQDFVPPRGAVVLGIPLGGSAPAIFMGRTIVPGHVMVITSERPHEFLCQGGMDVVAVVLPQQRLAGFLTDAAKRSGGLRSGVLKPAADWDLGAWLAALLADLVRADAPASGGPGPGAASAAVAARCLRVLAQTAPAERRGHALSPRARQRIAAEARHIIDRSIQLLPSIGEVAETLGVSVRTLEYCFADSLGISPLQYVRTVRLNHARRELRLARAADTTVAEIAMKWGFWHLGRFSAAYKSVFDESPSQTLRR